MRADADFMVYVAARWPSLVREAVRLGVRPDEAASAAADALARSRRGWQRAGREEGVDALVHDELAAAAARRPRTPEGDRERAAEELLVLAPPTLQELRRRQRENDQAVLRRVALVGVPLLLVVVGAAVYLGRHDQGDTHRPPDEHLENVAISREENPLPGVVWYADGQLHLDHAVLAVEGVRTMTRMGDGVLYGDDQGQVVYAADDGSRELLGHSTPGEPVVASDENGWAAWVETSGPRPVVMVVEAATGNEVGRLLVPTDTTMVAVDGDAVYYSDARGAYALLPQGGTTINVTPAGLLDVRARTRAFQVNDTTIQVVQSLFDAEITVPGQGAELSADAELVVTQLPGDDEPVAYDARSGQQLPSGLQAGDHVVAWTPGDRHTITYVVAPARATPGRELELRTCELDPGRCRTAARIPNQGGTPVLAR